MLKSGSVPLRTQTKQHKTNKAKESNKHERGGHPTNGFLTPSWTFRSEQQAAIKPSYSSSVRTVISNTSQPCLSNTDSSEPCSGELDLLTLPQKPGQWYITHRDRRFLLQTTLKISMLTTPTQTAPGQQAATNDSRCKRP